MELTKAGKSSKNDKEKALKEAIAKITKSHGEGTILILGDDDVIDDVESISTGSIGLDKAIGVGGIPRGRITEIFGKEATGKTQLCLHIIAEAQKISGRAALVDAEHALDTKFARSLGVDTKSLLISQPDSGEQALSVTESLIASGALDVVVVDSVAALVPQAELDGEMGDTHVALQARLMGQACRKLSGMVSRTKTCLIFVNQIRTRIGHFIGSGKNTSGGEALKFYASVRLEVERVQTIKGKDDEIIGHVNKVKVVKNKVAAPFKSCLFENIYGRGIDQEGEILDWGEHFGLIEKNGAWYSYKEERLGQGRENAKQFLRDNKNIKDGIRKVLRGCGV